MEPEIDPSELGELLQYLRRMQVYDKWYGKRIGSFVGLFWSGLIMIAGMLDFALRDQGGTNRRIVWIVIPTAGMLATRYLERSEDMVTMRQLGFRGLTRTLMIGLGILYAIILLLHVTDLEPFGLPAAGIITGLMILVWNRSLHSEHSEFGEKLTWFTPIMAFLSSIIIVVGNLLTNNGLFEYDGLIYGMLFGGSQGLTMHIFKTTVDRQFNTCL